MDAARALLARAGAAGLPTGELALYAAWSATSRSGEPRRPRAAAFDAVAPLAVALEALLRVQEVDAFARSSGCSTARRSRRASSASCWPRMYLRRGFLDSAAEEWLAVCRRDPRDVRGLVGLAQVAAAQGMPDDALEFAREARALDPGDRRATRLLERLEPLAA